MSLIQTTQTTIDLLNSNGRTFRVKLVNDSNEYTDILSLKWSVSLPTYLSIGNAICTCIQCSAMGISTSINGTWLDVYITIVGSDEWVKIGHFKAEKPTVQNDIVTFTAYDAMNEFSKTVFNKKLGVVTLKECYKAIISSINSVVSNVSYVDISSAIASLEINADMICGYDCRSALAYIAGYVGCNCVINNTGAIQMRAFTTCNYTLNADRIDVPELSDNRSSLNFLAASVDNSTKLLSGSDGEGLEFICPIMTQERLDALYSTLNSTSSPISSFKAGKIKHLLGDFRLQLGDVITLEYGDETYTIPISSISFEFDGGLSCDIESLPLAEVSELSIADSLDFVSKQNYNKTIKEITNYYLATSLDKDVTISTTGWTESTQTVTSENRYLWNYECIELVDGTKYQTEPCIIGNFALDGVGIESITEYYVTTKTTVQPQKSEFLTDIQTPTESKPYLWNYEIIAYTDDSKEAYESDIRLIGVYSKDGQPGATYYTWIKYADDANGKNMSDEPTGKSYVGIAVNQISATESDNASDYKWSLMKGTDGVTYYTWIKYADSPTSGMNDSPEGKTYMGIAYNKTTVTESTNYSDYTWSLIKGTDGVKGEPGDDGTTYYTWIKYADDANGTNMSDSPTNKMYIGLAYNKTSATESNNATDYSWALFRGADGVKGDKGDPGDDGTSVSSVVTQYYLSTSETSQAGGSWSTTAPTWKDGYYLWTRLKTTYSNNTVTYSTPVVDASWKKVTAVEEASKELNENLANALGLYVTEITVSGTVVRYYHSRYPLASCINGDTILVFNASGFGVCKTGWNGGSPVFDYGTTFDGKAVWDILVANKIKADYIEAGAISSVDDAKVQSKWDLDTGEMKFTSDDTQIIIRGQGSSTSIGEADTGVYIMNKDWQIDNECGQGFKVTKAQIGFVDIEYLYEKYKYDKYPNSFEKPADPYNSDITQKKVKTTDVECKNMRCIDGIECDGDIMCTDVRFQDGSTSYSLSDELSYLDQVADYVSEAITALQQKVTELETALGQNHEHTAATAITDNYVAPSCTEYGSYDSVVYCATCGEEMSRETISISPTGHTDSNGDGICDKCTAVLEYVLTADQSLTVDVAQCTTGGGSASSVDISQFTLIKFVASKKGKYTFTSAQGTLTAGTSYDTYGRLYDSTKSTILASDDDSGGNSQFKITQELEAGTYYLAVKFYQTASVGTVIVSAEYTEETPTYTITTAVSPIGSGTVTGGGTYTSGTSATLTATPNSGYTFKQWSDGVTSSTRSVTVSGDATYTAIFEVVASSEQTITEEVTTPVAISAANTNVYLKFVPKYSGKYTFVSLDQTDLDPDGYIYDSTKNSMLASDGKTGAVSVSYDGFVAGATYYLAIKLYKGTGTVNVKVSYDSSSSSGSTTYEEDTIVDGVLYIGTNTTEIATYAYYNQTTITSVVIPNSIIDISDYAFYNCTNITSISIGDNVTNIGVWAFGNCKLTTITIPTSVTTIGNCAFSGNVLTDVYYSGTQTQWNAIDISKTGNDPLTNATIHYNS